MFFLRFSQHDNWFRPLLPLSCTSLHRCLLGDVALIHLGSLFSWFNLCFCLDCNVKNHYFLFIYLFLLYWTDSGERQQIIMSREDGNGISTHCKQDSNLHFLHEHHDWTCQMHICWPPQLSADLESVLNIIMEIICEEKGKWDQDLLLARIKPAPWYIRCMYAGQYNMVLTKNKHWTLLWKAESRTWDQNLIEARFKPGLPTWTSQFSMLDVHVHVIYVLSHCALLGRN